MFRDDCLDGDLRVSDLTKFSLAARYTLFAVLATLANLATQRLLLPQDPDGRAFAIAVGAGTVAGLVVKYVLDKRWIFFDAAGGIEAHSRKFSLYTLTGVVTTAIFWGTETAFWLVWDTTVMRELGAVLGLMVGYVLKYQLDKRFVFRRAPGGE